MTLLQDSTDPAAIVAPEAVAGYIDGLYRWPAEAWASFPGIPHVTITVLGIHGARVCDCETGDLSSGAAAAWAVGELWSLRRPTIYCNRSTWPQVIAALAGLKVTPSQVDWWIADPTGTPHLIEGTVATQYAWHQLGQVAANVDLSLCAPGWPVSITPVTPPVSTPAPPARPATVAIMDYAPGNGYWEVRSDGGVFAYGRAPFLGSLGGKVLSAPIIDACATATGKGYRLVGADGAVYCWGDAHYFGGVNTLP